MDSIVERPTHAKHEKFLNEQLGMVREVLNINVDQLLTLISQRMRELQRETARQTENETKELRREVDRLRKYSGGDSITHSGGTGDTPLRATASNDYKAISNGHDKADVWAHPSPSVKHVSYLEPPDASPGYDIKEPGDHAPVLEISTPATNGQKYLESNAPASDSSKPKPVLQTSVQRATMRASFRARQDASAGEEQDKDESDSDYVSNGSHSDEEGVHHHHLHIGDEPLVNPNKRKSVFQSEPKSVFADAAAMKDKVRAAVAKKEYNVADFYYDSGCSQKIARSQYFEYLTLFIIAFNAIWISVDADLNKSLTLLDAEPVFQVAEHGFCLFFTFEWTCRFLSFRKKTNCGRDAWFVFDTALVIMMILETWVLTIVVLVTSGGGSSSGLGNTSVLKLVRLVRLTRMARMARLLRAVPELIILIKGIAVASRSVFFTLVLLVVIIYFFSIVFRQLTDGTDIGAMYFKTVPDGMSSLLLDGVLPDQASLVRDCGHEHIFFGVLSLCFILLASMTIMNMLVGVLCEVVSVVSAVEKEQLTVTYVKMRLQAMFGEWDTDGSMTISKHEFEKLLVKPEAAKIIQEIDVDCVGLVDFADYIFKDGTELTFVDFMELVLSLRGSNVATVKDIVDLRKFVITELTNVKHQVLSAMERINSKMQNNLQNKMRQSMMGMSSPNLLSMPMSMPMSSPVGMKSPILKSPRSDDIEEADDDEDRVGVTFMQADDVEDRVVVVGRNMGQTMSQTMSLPGQRPMSAHQPAGGQKPPSGQRPPSGGGRPGTSNNRPGTGAQRPQSGGSAVSSAALARLRQASASNDGQGNARNRDASPPLPDFPQRLWLGEVDEDDGGRPVTRS